MVVFVALGLAAAAYVTMRLTFNEQFEGATWRDLVELRAPLPFGHRVLVPWLCRPFVAAGASIRQAFAVAEWMAAVGLVVSVHRCLRALELHSKSAMAAAAGTLLVLPMPYLLPHRWPIFYPWDTPGMVVVTLAVLVSLRRQPRWGLVLVVVGALNRETAILVPAVYAAVCLPHGEDRRGTLAWCGLMLVAFVGVRGGISLALPDNPGFAVHWYLDGQLRVVSNLHWLADPRNILMFVGGLAFLPLLWLLLWRSMPQQIGRLDVVVLVTTVGLSFVANVYEPRAFGEVIMLSYVAVAAAGHSWLNPGIGEPIEKPADRG